MHDIYNKKTAIETEELYLLKVKAQHLMAKRLLSESISDARPSVMRLTASVAFA